MTVTMPTLGIAWADVAGGIDDFLSQGLIGAGVLFSIILALTPRLVGTVKRLVRR